MFLNDINARIGELDAELEGIASLTDPTDDDVARTEAILAERDDLRQKGIAAQERTQRIAAAHAQAKAEGRSIKGASFEFQKKVDPFDADTRYMDTAEVRDAARAILDRPESRYVADDGKAKAERLVMTLDDRLARYTVSTSRPEYRSAFAKYISGNEMLLTNEERMAVQAVKYESRTYMGLTDANGGYAVPVLLDPTVVYTGNGVANPMRAISRIETGMDDRWRGVSSAGITASYDPEGTAVSDDSPTFAQPVVPAFKGAAFAGISWELALDWAALTTEIGPLFAEAKDNLELTKFATGTGTAEPYGIVTALVDGSGTVSNVTPTTDGQFGAVDVRALFAALPPRYRGNASWISSIDVQNEVRALGDDKLGNQTVNLSADYNFQLLGRPYYENSGMGDFTGTTGVSNLLIVGDFRNFVIFDRIGAQLEVVPHLFSSDRPTSQRGLLFRWRSGSDSINDNAFRLLRNT